MRCVLLNIRLHSLHDFVSMYCYYMFTMQLNNFPRETNQSLIRQQKLFRKSKQNKHVCGGWLFFSKILKYTASVVRFIDSASFCYQVLSENFQITLAVIPVVHLSVSIANNIIAIMQRAVLMRNVVEHNTPVLVQHYTFCINNIHQNI